MFGEYQLSEKLFYKKNSSEVLRIQTLDFQELATFSAPVFQYSFTALYMSAVL
jgi:hypothetical protein